MKSIYLCHNGNNKEDFVIIGNYIMTSKKSCDKTPFKVIIVRIVKMIMCRSQCHVSIFPYSKYYFHYMEMFYFCSKKQIIPCVFCIRRPFKI